MLVVEKSKVSKRFQVAIPAKIRKALNLKEGDILIWTFIDGKLMIDVVHDNAEDILRLLGKVDMGPTNASEDMDEVVNEPEG
ncbi:MAG: AbrB/MazE/SpoVT family DNA-binding domain-containing protein [Candidatus Odinarchaeota archaeon]|nr:AbrB/MazE/SpoVT family DNA-binding domain-containing protein [Candidatus Odinarchaeota archaeon]